MNLFSQVFMNLLLRAWCLMNCYCQADSTDNNHMSLRQKLIEEEQKLAFGANITLNEDEIIANECLMIHKKNEVDEGFKDPKKFLPARNFMETRKDIEKSEIYQIIRKMPKGGVFHAHSTAIANLDHLVYNVTRLPNLYICENAPEKYQFRFFENPDDTCNWTLLSNFRETNSRVDQIIRDYLLKLAPNYDDIDSAWAKFDEIYKTLRGIIKYRPVFEDYFYKAMQELYDDNVMFMEIRSSLSFMYELNGTRRDSLEIVKIYKETADRFVQEHPDFLGIKIIYAPRRKLSQDRLKAAIEKYEKVKASYPDVIVGFDLVGQEDKGYPLVDFVDQLQVLGKTTTFYFHAGETNWYGTSSDYNLYDAVLLNTKRIGHGYALLKHPKLMQIIKEKQIAIELTPISNQVLHLVHDMRNHPASYFFAENLPVVVSNDDPSYWEARGLSHDFYETFVGIMSREADLKALKQLAINSIVYSSFNEDERKKAFEIFEESWRTFIKELIDSPMCNN